MNRRTYNALDGSILKWKGIVEETIEDEGSDNCPLCQLFFGKERSGCVGCPVTQATERVCCRGTPYDDFCDADDCNNYDGMKKSAKDMLLFLQALVPAGGPDEA